MNLRARFESLHCRVTTEKNGGTFPSALVNLCYVLCIIPFSGDLNLSAMDIVCLFITHHVTMFCVLFGFFVFAFPIRHV